MGEQTDLALDLAELHDPSEEDMEVKAKPAANVWPGYEQLAAEIEHLDRYTDTEEDRIREREEREAKDQARSDAERARRAVIIGEIDPDPLTLSVSEIRVLRQCPRRYFHEYVQDRRSARVELEQEWGAALHRGLEAWLERRRFFPGDDEIGVALYAALATGTDDNGRPYAPPADPYARAALRAMLRAYAAVWGPVDAERYEVLHVELPFNLPILTRTGRRSVNGAWQKKGARREGRLDAVVRDRYWRCAVCDVTTGSESDGEPSPCHGALLNPGGVWVTEHKSTGKPPGEDRFYAGIELDLQTATYLDAARLAGLNPKGVLFDVIRRPDFNEPKPAPALTKSGKERKAPSQVCETCDGRGGEVVPCGGCDGGKIGGGCSDCGGAGSYVYSQNCPTCKGEGRVTKTVAYSNPRFGESASDYEERIYQLATSKPGDYFGRRELPILDWQIEEARAAFWSASREIKAFERAGVWPMVGDRYVCAPRGRVCPWLDVCGRRESGDDDRLFPLKSRKEGER